MRHKSWSLAALPLVVMLLMLTAVLLVQRGLPLEARATMLDYLATSPVPVLRREGADVVVAVSSKSDTALECFNVTADVLNFMRIPWRRQEMSQDSPIGLTGVRALLICSQDLSALQTIAPQLIQWVEEGGRLALMMAPQDNNAFYMLSHKLGITEYAGGYVEFTSLRYTSGLLPMWGDQQIYTCGGFLNDFALAVRLEDDCDVHMKTGSEHAIPLLWSRDMGRGRIVVNNNTLVQNKDGRGQATAVLFALADEIVYPIINAGMVFIDDFPAPQPEGANEALLQEFGYDIQGFYRNHWWPEVKKLALENGLRYTGVLVETYNRQISGPFEPEGEDDSLIRYYASELLQSGCEIGLHGYNHIPLCPDGFTYGGERYITWPSGRQMADSLRELYRYGSAFLTGAEFRTYVPPSNYLSDTGKEVLLETVGQVRTISGLYLKEEGVNALIQEFREEEDGSISVPRITAGFAPNQYGRYVLAQELLLHGVVSHFIHPDDVLDPKRNGSLTWDQMYAAFSDLMNDIATSYPPLKWSTASEGAAAVQRYGRLEVLRSETPDGLQVELSPFYGEAWLALKAERKVRQVVNGACFEISEGFYWVRADGPEVIIRWEVEQ